MLGRIAGVAAAFAIATLGLASCGTTTTTNDAIVPVEAGCPHVVVDDRGAAEVPPDGVKACPAGDCNYQSGSGCGAGLACRPQFSADSKDVTPGCEPAGKAESGEPCKANSDCAANHYCAEGACRKQCCAGDWSACSEDERCLRQVEALAGGVVVDTGLEVCVPVNDCDPLDPAPCPSAPSRECKVVDLTGAVACVPVGTQQVGEACGATKVCVAGSSCVLNVCRRLCRAEECGEPACGEGEGTCVHVRRDPPGVGVCTLGF